MIKETLVKMFWVFLMKNELMVREIFKNKRLKINKIYNENCIAEKDSIIKPNGFIIPESASKIHGITTQKARAEGTDLLPVLIEFAEDVKKADLIVAHNMNFDNKIVAAELLRNNIVHQLFSTPKICTMINSTKYCKIPRFSGGYKWPNLKELHKKLFDCNFENAHDALSDVKACAKCFFELKKLDIIKL